MTSAVTNIAVRPPGPVNIEAASWVWHSGLFPRPEQFACGRRVVVPAAGVEGLPGQRRRRAVGGGGWRQLHWQGAASRGDGYDALGHAQAVLEAVFGFRAFRSHQASIITDLIEGRDVLALMPTGGGKSLCYQIPSLVRRGTGIVVSPLIALMQDQVDALKELGVKAAYLNSSLSIEEQRQIERALGDGRLDLLYIAPERLLTERTLTLLASADIALIAIDEAHCVSQWGHDFRPEYRGLSTLADVFPHVPRIALTATADVKTRVEIAETLRLTGASHYVASFDRPNIRYSIADEGSGSARERLWAFMKEEHPDDAGIVYCLSRKQVDETAAWLSAKGRVALPYHAGLDNDVRRRHQQRFLREEAHHRRRHHRLRHGNRQAGRAVRRPSVAAEVGRGLLPGDRPGRSRWRSGRYLDGVLAAGCGDDEAVDQRLGSERGAEAAGAAEARRADRPHRVHLMPAAGAACLFRRDARAAMRQLRQLPDASGHHRPHRRCAEGIVGDLPDRRALRRDLCDRRADRQDRGSAHHHNGHDRLPVFGIGKDIAVNEWRPSFAI